MHTKKLSHLQTFNTLGMWEFETLKLVDDTLFIQAHQGYPHYFWAEIVFLGVEYIACPISFFSTQLRFATAQDTPLVKRYQAINVYCFEEISPLGGESAEISFIAARSIEMTIHYSGENLDEILHWPDDEGAIQH